MAATKAIRKSTAKPAPARPKARAAAPKAKVTTARRKSTANASPKKFKATATTKPATKGKTAKVKNKAANNPKLTAKSKLDKFISKNSSTAKSDNIFSQAKTKKNQKAKLESKKQELKGLGLKDLKFESSYVNNPKLKSLTKDLIGEKTKAKQQKDQKADERKKSGFNSLALNRLKKMLGSSNKKFDNLLKGLIGKKEAQNPQAGSCPSGKCGKGQQSKQGGSCGQGGQSSPGGSCGKQGGEAGGAGEGPSGTGDANQAGEAEGQSQGNDQDLQQAHEEAAKDCESLAQKEDKPQGSSKGCTTWKKLAKYIRNSATTAVWKSLGGKAAARCHSNGKTEYDPKYKGQINKLKEFIVHENTHAIEFKEQGNSDEKDTYAIHREFGKKIQGQGK